MFLSRKFEINFSTWLTQAFQEPKDTHCEACETLSDTPNQLQGCMGCFPVYNFTFSHPHEITNRWRLTHRPAIKVVCVQIWINFDSLPGFYFEPLYLLLAFAYRVRILRIPPRIPFSIINNIFESLNNSSFTPVFFKQASQASPGPV